MHPSMHLFRFRVTSNDAWDLDLLIYSIVILRKGGRKGVYMYMYMCIIIYYIFMVSYYWVST
ncbi:hypothetical protein BofuT4_uP073580.1 [Botrytis cinerea T4]|uniref:Uncharacterized protein n=1 Tax=Botryotinia fuckeliana (strain T4) TaxID=999810 RepID=G2XPE0_BOTF4|nr:hypothetical protein BofuT4_uP073580.1 [Botrytis cinerea T4]